MKHNRSENFHLASLENLLKAIASVFVVLFSQFYIFAFEVNREANGYTEDDTDFWISHNNSLFSIKLPRTWKPKEYYDFNWTNLKGTPNPFESASF